MGQFQPGNQAARKTKSFIQRRYDGDSLEEHHEYNNLYQNDPRHNPALIPDLPLPKPLDNASTFFNKLNDGSREYLGLKTGLKEFDELISGLQKFVLFAGAGGTGKSTLALQLALGVIENGQCPVIYYCFEMEQFDVYTMLTQLAGKETKDYLSKQDILLHGNDKNQPETMAKVQAARSTIDKYKDNLYVLGASDAPDLVTMEAQIKGIMQRHSTNQALVIIDSVQDVLLTGMSGTEAEAATAAAITAMQQSTGATILGISQKSKSGFTNGGYGSVLGSVSWVHKPTAVLEFIGVKEAITQLPKKEQAKFYSLSNLSDIAQPVFARVIKGRNTGYGQIALKYHGRDGYFESGRVKDYDTEPSLYRALHFPDETAYDKALRGEL